MDPFDAFTRWQNWRVEGTPSQLASVLARLDANLPAGWRKPGHEEVSQLDVPLGDGAIAYCLDATPAHIAVGLSIIPVQPTGLCGGQFWFGGSSRPPAKMDRPAVWEEVTRFLDQGIKPAAEGVAARVWVPSMADLFFKGLPLDIRDLLQTFLARSGKALPLGKDAIRLWHEFVVAAFRFRTRVESEPLRDWLTSQGWPTTAANEMVSSYYDHCQLLTRYVEELAAV